jgi:hypothetical protein
MSLTTSHISFVSGAEKLTLASYQVTRRYTTVGAEIIGRIVAGSLLSTSAALDLAIHSTLIFPTLLYALGKSVHQRQRDFTLPWQHLQRVRNTVSPLLLGSACGILHPYFGVMVSEPADKHAVMGMLLSNISKNTETICSPVQSLTIVENLVNQHRDAFSREDIQVIKDARSFEASLEKLQVQEYLYKITNTTFYALAALKNVIENSRLDRTTQNVIMRASVVLVPILTALDTSIALFVQTIFLVTGAIRLVSGRSPIYTEVTSDPLMHVTFLIQNTLKLVGNIIGMLFFLYSPELGLRVSMLSAMSFFKLQMNMFMIKMNLKMRYMQDNTRFVIPILYSDGQISPMAIPTHDSHKTYLIVEKKAGQFNLFWVNRPNIDHISNLSHAQALQQIRSMLHERYPFMDMAKLLSYPLKSVKPEFKGVSFAKIADQGAVTNCVVSNIFGTLEALDKVKHESENVSGFRYQVARASLMKAYSFYRTDFFPFAERYSLASLFQQIQESTTDFPLSI